MKSSLFLYTTPFIIPDTPANRTQFLSETVRITEYEREDELRLNAMVIDFAHRQGLIKINATGTGYVTEVFNVAASWQWQVYWTNMRGLVDRQRYSDVCMSFQSDDGFPLAMLLNLHFHLGTVFDLTLLNTIVNRILHAVQLVPYDVSQSTATVDWETIHQETPWIWLVMLLQALIQQEAAPPILTS